MVKCDYCGQAAELVTGAKVYPHRRDLHDKNFWYCENGHDPVYVGCHNKHPKYSPKGTTPLGRLADAELRKAKSEAHAAFDPLWRGEVEFKTRREAYEWLSCELQIPFKACHIGMFDIPTCKEVTRLSKELAETLPKTVKQHF